MDTTNYGALIGGIVGGIVALLLIGGLIAFLVVRNRRNKDHGEEGNAMAKTTAASLPPSNYDRIPENEESRMYDDVRDVRGVEP